MKPYKVVTEASQLPAIAREIREAEAVGLDIETTSLDPRQGEIRLIQINTGKGIYVIDLFQTKTAGPIPEALAGPVVKIIQNAKFESTWFLYKYNVEFWPLFDTFRASALLYNGRTGVQHNLYALYERELGIKHEGEDESVSDWSKDVLSRSQLNYAAEDVFYLHDLRKVLKPKLKKAGLNPTALIEFGAVLPESSVELNGFYLDPVKWRAIAKSNEKMRARYQAKLYKQLPSPAKQLVFPGFDPVFNLGSSSQMLTSLRMLGMTQNIKNAFGEWVEVPLQDTKELTLAMLSEAYPVVEDIFKWREANHALNTFGEKYLRFISPVTGRIHASYWPFLLSGRYAPSKPNLSQVPGDKRYRGCFCAPEGWVIMAADYCVAEGTLVATSTGLKSIETVKVGDLVPIEDGTLHRVERVLDRGTKEVFTVRTKNGYSLKATAGHRIRVRDINGSYAWKRVEDLNEDDAVAVQAGRGLPEGDTPTQLDISINPRGRAPYILPTEVDTNLAELFGYLTGDGWYLRRTVGHQSSGFGFVVCDKDLEVSTRLRGTVEDKFGVTLTPPARYRGVEETRSHSVDIASWMEKAGFSKDRVPDFLFHSSAAVVASYLRGLFEADGSCWTDANGRTGLVFDSASQYLASQIQQLLLALGIPSKVTTRSTGVPGKGITNRVKIPMGFYASYQYKIGFMSDRKKDRLALTVDHERQSKKSSELVDLPNIKPLFDDATLTTDQKVLTRNVRCTGRARGLELAKKLKEDHKDLYEHLDLGRTLEGGTYFDRLLEVVPAGNTRVWDLEVPGPVTYLSGPFVSHNCNIEMRIIAEISQDPVLSMVFLSDEGRESDAHYKTASIIMGKPIDSVTSAERKQAKPVNFGLCLTPGTQVITEHGYRAIETVEVGTRVRTHRGGLKAVTDTQKLKANRLLRIRTRTGKKIECTPDHMWYVHFPAANGKPAAQGWVEAQDLKEGQYLVYHHSMVPQDPSASTPEYDRARILGWYISEGSLSTNGLIIPQSRRTNGDVYERMCEILPSWGFKERKAPSDGDVSRFFLPAEHHSAIFEDLGLTPDAKSREKRLPPGCTGWQQRARYQLLAGLWDGAGSVSQSRRGKVTITYTSNSMLLLGDIKRLLDSVGINSTVHGVYDSSDCGVLHITGSKSNKAFLVDVPTEKTAGVSYDPKKCSYAEEKIISIEQVDYDGYVYDLTVDEDHSFIANGLVTHNCYGMGPEKLVLYAMNYGVRLTQKQARQFHKRYFEAYHGVRSWHSRVMAESEKNPVSRSLGGRLRYIENERAFNEFKNNPVQSTGADGLKSALREVYTRLKLFGDDVMMVHHIHDEIVLQVRNDPFIIDGAKKALSEGMKAGMSKFLPTIPVTVDVGVGPSWGDAH